MIRRRKLIRTTLAGAAATAAVGVAGCTGGEESTEPTEYPEGVDPEEAQNHYDEAIDELLEAHGTLDDWAAGRPGRDQQAIDRVRNHVDQAKNSLDEAAAVAPAEIMDQIEAARSVAKFQEALLQFYEIGLQVDKAESDAQAFGDQEQHERAVEKYQEAKDLLGDARTQLEEVANAHSQIDADAIDESDLEYSGDHTLYVDVEGPGSIDAKERQIDGKRQSHQMFVQLNAGFEHFEAEEFVDARERFTVAQEERQATAEAFEASIDHDAAWDSLRQESIQLLGIAEDLEEAITLFIDATHEGEAGNHQEATELAEEGFFVLEQAFQQE